MGYAVFGSLTSILLAFLLAATASVLPVLQGPPVIALITILLVACAVCLALFVVLTMVGLVTAMVRSRPGARKNASQPRSDWSVAAKRLRRLALITLGFSIVLVAPLVLAGQIPAYFLVIVLGPTVLYVIGLLPRKRVAPK
jgi:Na+/melibiose symporter-like transporter